MGKLFQSIQKKIDELQNEGREGLYIEVNPNFATNMMMELTDIGSVSLKESEDNTGDTLQCYTGYIGYFVGIPIYQNPFVPTCRIRYEGDWIYD